MIAHLSHRISIALAALTILAAGCGKTEIPKPGDIATASTAVANGIGNDFRSINGYLYAGLTDRGAQPSLVSMYAVFAEPAVNLMANYNHRTDVVAPNSILSTNANRGNVNVKSVMFNAYTLQASTGPSAWEYGANSLTANDSMPAAWVTEGNRSFKPLNLVVPRNRPYMKDTLIRPKKNDTIHVKTGYSLVVSNNIFNYDSLVVELASQSGSGPVMLRKVFRPGLAVTFTSQELTPFTNAAASNAFGVMSFQAFNYSNQVISDKKYVFALSYKWQSGNLVHLRP